MGESASRRRLRARSYVPMRFGLAVPLARELARLRLRASGVFLRRPGVLDRALSVRKIVFDKTGTLTKGLIRLDDASLETLAVWSANISRSSTTSSVRASIQCPAPSSGRSSDSGRSGSGPAARAADAVREERGAGLEWRHPSGRYRLGRASFARGFTAPADAASTAVVPRPKEDGAGAEDQPASVVFSLDGRSLAVLRLIEELKEDAGVEARALRQMGYQLFLFTGDLLARARRVSRELGFSDDAVQAELTPEGKVAALRELDACDTVMVGDGLNDASSLEAAWISGTPAVDLPAVPARCDFFFFGEGVSAVRDVLSVAKRLRAVVRLDLAIAVTYNVAALALALAGIIDPLVAALLMPASSIGLVLFTRPPDGEGAQMDVLVILLFISLVFVLGALAFFLRAVGSGDIEQGDRISLLPWTATVRFAVRPCRASRASRVRRERGRRRPQRTRRGLRRRHLRSRPESDLGKREGERPMETTMDQMDRASHGRSEPTTEVTYNDAVVRAFILASVVWASYPCCWECWWPPSCPSGKRTSTSNG